MEESVNKPEDRVQQVLQQQAQEMIVELERVKRELEQSRTQHQQEVRRGAIREAVGAATDPEVAAMLVEKSLTAGGVPPVGAELVAAAKRAAEQLKRDKPYLFAPVTEMGAVRSAIAAPTPEPARTDCDAKALADEARGTGDRRALMRYLAVRSGRVSCAGT